VEASGPHRAMACVVETWGSAPRPPGSRLVVDVDGNFSVQELIEARLRQGLHLPKRSNYSSSEVRAPGHIRNKTVTAATQTPTIENHAGAREVDTEFPLFLLSNIRAPCLPSSRA
jgi:hypothetical protein